MSDIKLIAEITGGSLAGIIIPLVIYKLIKKKKDKNSVEDKIITIDEIINKKKSYESDSSPHKYIFDQYINNQPLSKSSIDKIIDITFDDSVQKVDDEILEKFTNLDIKKIVKDYFNIMCIKVENNNELRSDINNLLKENEKNRVAIDKLIREYKLVSSENVKNNDKLLSNIISLKENDKKKDAIDRLIKEYNLSSYVNFNEENFQEKLYLADLYIPGILNEIYDTLKLISNVTEKYNSEPLEKIKKRIILGIFMDDEIDNYEQYQEKILNNNELYNKFEKCYSTEILNNEEKQSCDQFGKRKIFYTTMHNIIFRILNDMNLIDNYIHNEKNKNSSLTDGGKKRKTRRKQRKTLSKKRRKNKKNTRKSKRYH